MDLFFSYVGRTFRDICFVFANDIFVLEKGVNLVNEIGVGINII